MSIDIVIAHGGDVSISGSGVRVKTIASGLAKRGYEVCLIVPSPSNKLPKSLNEVRVKTIPVKNVSLSTQPIRAILISRAAARIRRENSALLQIEHSTLAGVYSSIFSDEYILDMLDLAHDSPLYGDRFFGSGLQILVRQIEARGIANANHVITVSDEMKNLVADNFGRENYIYTIPNGYSKDLVPKINHRSKNENQENVVIYLGSLYEKLDIGSFIETAKQPSVDKLLIIGDGPRRLAIEHQISSANIDNIEITGRLEPEEAHQLAATGTLAINPQRQSDSANASSPVKLYYYSALKLPMVISSGPSVARKLGSNGAAVVVDPSDDFANTVENIISDQKRLNKMRNSSAYLANEFSWEKRLDQICDIYNKYGNF